MSLMDKLKAMFSGGSDSPDHSHEGHDHAHDHPAAVDDVPPAPPTPVDPLGTSMPEAGPVPPSTPPPTDRDDETV